MEKVQSDPMLIFLSGNLQPLGISIPDFQLQFSRSKLKFIFAKTKIFFFYKHVLENLVLYEWKLEASWIVWPKTIELQQVFLKFRSVYSWVSCDAIIFSGGQL